MAAMGSKTSGMTGDRGPMEGHEGGMRSQYIGMEGQHSAMKGHKGGMEG